MDPRPILWKENNCALDEHYGPFLVGGGERAPRLSLTQNEVTPKHPSTLSTLAPYSREQVHHRHRGMQISWQLSQNKGKPIKFDANAFNNIFRCHMKQNWNFALFNLSETIMSGKFIKFGQHEPPLRRANTIMPGVTSRIKAEKSKPCHQSQRLLFPLLDFYPMQDTNLFVVFIAAFWLLIRLFLGFFFL